MRNSRRWLYGVLAAGLIGLGAGGGTFATFNAQTTNPGNTFSTGSLVLTDTPGGGSLCNSDTGAGNNVNNACGVVTVSPGSEEPGSLVANTVVIANGGTINGSVLNLEAPYVNANLTTGLTDTVAVTSLAFSGGLEGNITTGDNLVVTSGSNTQTFVAAANAAGGATSVAVNSLAATFSFPTGSIVTDTSSNIDATTSTDCYDTQVFALGTLNPTIGNPLCNSALLFVEETTQSGTGEAGAGSNSYCWYGTSSTTNCPVAVNLSGTLVTGTPITALPVTALNSAITASGQTITLNYGGYGSSGHTQTFTTSGTAAVGATSIPVNSQAPNYAFPSGTFGGGTYTTVFDSTEAAANLSPSDTIAAFDTTHPVGSPLGLTPLNGVGTTDTSGAITDLPSSASRTFLVGLYLPSGAGNQVQDLTTHFGISWYMSQ